MHEKFMRVAIEEAKRSLVAGGTPLAAIMVKDGKVIAVGHAQVGKLRDPTAHGEAECIKIAVKALNSLDLAGCTMYSTVETCSMCLSCGAWSGLTKVVFGAFKEDIVGNPYEFKNYHAIEHVKNLQVPWTSENIEIIGGVLKKDCAELMKNFKNWAPN
ncbi:nucleoside deaminase [bacterium]|nr:nucleoside deaminase [bacterium]